MKKTIIFRLALVLPVFLGLAIAAEATPISLTMTEVSSTTLTYSWNGGSVQTVTATIPDHWSFNIIDDVVTALGGLQNINVQWQEPEYASTSLVNYVNFYQYGPAANGTAITVISDNPLDPNHTYPTELNGQAYTFPVSGGNTVAFNDNGDRVPDGGTTIGLLGIGLLGLAFFGRRLVSA